MAKPMKVDSVVLKDGDYITKSMADKQSQRKWGITIYPKNNQMNYKEYLSVCSEAFADEGYREGIDYAKLLRKERARRKKSNVSMGDRKNYLDKHDLEQERIAKEISDSKIKPEVIKIEKLWGTEITLIKKPTEESASLEQLIKSFDKQTEIERDKTIDLWDKAFEDHWNQKAVSGSFNPTSMSYAEYRNYLEYLKLSLIDESYNKYDFIPTQDYRQEVNREFRSRDTGIAYMLVGSENLDERINKITRMQQELTETKRKELKLSQVQYFLGIITWSPYFQKVSAKKVSHKKLEEFKLLDQLIRMFGKQNEAERDKTIELWNEALENHWSQQVVSDNYLSEESASDPFNPTSMEYAEYRNYLEYLKLTLIDEQIKDYNNKRDFIPTQVYEQEVIREFRDRQEANFEPKDRKAVGLNFFFGEQSEEEIERTNYIERERIERRRKELKLSGIHHFLDKISVNFYLGPNSVEEGK